jgi:thioredoxin reductase
MRIAIIGGGVQGISLLAELQEAGFNCMLFESYIKIGGIWAQSLHVPYLSLQICSQHYRYPDFSWGKNIPKPSGKKICKYLNSYIENKNLEKYIYLNSTVTNVIENDNNCILTINNKYNITADIILCTGKSTIPNFDKIYKKHKNAIHTSQITKKHINSAKNHKCVVIGGSKSAADAVYHFSQNGATVYWVARRFNTFAKFNSKTSLSLLKILKSFGNEKYIFDLKIHKNDPIHVGTGNVVTEKEYNVLKNIKTFKNSVKSVNYDYITLMDNTILYCDTLIIATGYIDNKCSMNIENRFNKKSNKIIANLDLKPLITTFGCINSHLVARAMVTFLKSNEWKKKTFQDWWNLHTLNNWGLFLYQIKYLLTTGKINKFDLYKAKQLSILLKFLCLIILIFLINKMY